MKNPEMECIFGRNMFLNAVHNAFLNASTMETPARALRLLFNNGIGSDIPMFSPSK